VHTREGERERERERERAREREKRGKRVKHKIVLFYNIKK
jgi:hypothetical protein